jgi:hypothetical protein
MRKGTKKLTLCKETILRLEELACAGVHGGTLQERDAKMDPTFASGCCLTKTCGTWCAC